MLERFLSTSLSGMVAVGVEVGMCEVEPRGVSAYSQEMSRKSADWRFRRRLRLRGSHGQVRRTMLAMDGDLLVRGSACGCAEPAKPSFMSSVVS